MSFVPCAACARHVKSSDASCPFCDAPMPTALGSQTAAARGPIARDRAALLFGAALASAIGMGACNSSPTGGPVAPAYGGPNAVAPTMPVADAGPPAAPVMVAAYGAPMVMLDASPPTPPSVDAGAAPKPKK